MFWLLLIFNLNAMDLNERAHLLLNARDFKTLKKGTNSFGQYQKEEARCEFELVHNKIPQACYGLKLSAEKIKIVDQACERAVLNMKEEFTGKGLSAICAKAVIDKNRDIQYTKQEETPERLILKKM